MGTVFCIYSRNTRHDDGGAYMIHPTCHPGTSKTPSLMVVKYGGVTLRKRKHVSVWYTACLKLQWSYCQIDVLK